MSIGKTRRAAYGFARFLGDVDAILHPKKLPKRIANKVIGRKVARRLFFK